MSYDEDLADRVRAVLAAEEDVTERKMFGGLAFLVAGHMAVAASGQGGLLLRIDPEQGDALLDRPHVSPFVMRNRPMEGWLRVEPEATRDPGELAAWVAHGVARARSLPPKG